VANLDVYHPAYEDHNWLLSIPADDNGAVDYGAALTLCGIICVNPFSGWFSISKMAVLAIQRIRPYSQVLFISL
jgi:hypothetical protein